MTANKNKRPLTSKGGVGFSLSYSGCFGLYVDGSVSNGDLSLEAADIHHSLVGIVLHAFCVFSFEPYLNLRLSVFPCDHAEKVLLDIVSTDRVIPSPLAQDQTLYFALQISCSLAEV